MPILDKLLCVNSEGTRGLLARGSTYTFESYDKCACPIVMRGYLLAEIQSGEPLRYDGDTIICPDCRTEVNPRYCFYQWRFIPLNDPDANMNGTYDEVSGKSPLALVRPNRIEERIKALSKEAGKLSVSSAALIKAYEVLLKGNHHE